MMNDKWLWLRWLIINHQVLLDYSYSFLIKTMVQKMSHAESKFIVCTYCNIILVLARGAPLVFVRFFLLFYVWLAFLFRCKIYILVWGIESLTLFSMSYIFSLGFCFCIHTSVCFKGEFSILLFALLMS